MDERPRRSPAARWLMVAIVGAALIALIFGYRVYRERQAREEALGAMVVAFQKQNSLNVFRAQVPVFVTNSKSRWLGLSRIEQIGVIPATVEYRLDLSKLEEGSFRWDEDAQTMTVTIPPVVVSSPVLDTAHAKLVNRGILITGDQALDLLNANLETARATAINEANNPEMLSLAQAAAKEAMAQNIAVPLKVAGYDDAKIVVRFATEGDGGPAEYLDRSRSYTEVIEEARRNRR